MSPSATTRSTSRVPMSSNAAPSATAFPCASETSATRKLAPVGEVLEQVGAGEHRLGLALAGHDDRLVLLPQVGEHLVHGIEHVDRAERRLHRRGDVLAE